MQLIFSRDTWELLSFVVTVIGLPLAIVVFAFEQRKERDNEEEEVYQLLSDNYQDFLKVALANPDLGLFSAVQTPALAEQQKERRVIIFSMREGCECAAAERGGLIYARSFDRHAPIKSMIPASAVSAITTRNKVSDCCW